MSELERLRDRIAELEDAMGLTAEIPRDLVPLTGQQSHPAIRRMIGILLTRPFGEKSAIYNAMYGARPECDQPDPKILDVYITYVRKVLKPYGIVLRTQWSKGWYLDNQNKAKLRAVIERLNAERETTPVQPKTQQQAA